MRYGPDLRRLWVPRPPAVEMGHEAPAACLLPTTHRPQHSRELETPACEPMMNRRSEDLAGKIFGEKTQLDLGWSVAVREFSRALAVPEDFVA